MGNRGGAASILGNVNPNMLSQLMGQQNPQQGAPQTSLLNSYNFNPYQQNQMGGMGYGMMNQVMAKLMNPQGMQNPAFNQSLFTTGPGYQSPMMQPNFNRGVNMAPIGENPSIYGFQNPLLAAQQRALEEEKKKKKPRREGGGNEGRGGREGSGGGGGGGQMAGGDATA